MASGDMPEPGALVEDLQTLAELSDSTREARSGEKIDYIVDTMVEELRLRKSLRVELQQLQRNRDCVLVRIY